VRSTRGQTGSFCAALPGEPGEPGALALALGAGPKVARAGVEGEVGDRGLLSGGKGGYSG